MTPDEIRAKIKELGLEQGAWGATPTLEGRPAFMNQQMDLFLQLRTLLEAEEQKMQAELQGARETLVRMTRGGGS